MEWIKYLSVASDALIHFIFLQNFREFKTNMKERYTMADQIADTNSKVNEILKKFKIRNDCLNYNCDR